MKLNIVLLGSEFRYMPHYFIEAGHVAEYLLPRVALMPSICRTYEVDVVVLPLYINETRGMGITLEEIGENFHAGAAFIKKQFEHYPKAVFFLIDGLKQQIVEAGPRVVLCEKVLELAPQAIVERVQEEMKKRR